MNAQKRVLKYVLAYRSRLIAAGLASLGVAGCTLVIAWLAGMFLALDGKEPLTHLAIVRFGIRHGFFDARHAGMGMVFAIAILLVLINLPKAVGSYVLNYLVASVTNRMGTDVRQEMYAHLQTLPLSYFHRSKIGHIIARMSYDVNLIQSSSAVVVTAIDGPTMLISGLARMIWISWKLTALTIVFVPLMGLGIDRLTKKIRGLTTATQSKLADVNAYIDESMRGVRIVKSFGMEDQEVRRFGRANTNSLTAALRAARRGALVIPAIEVMGSVATAFVILVGGLMVVRGDISFSKLGEFGVLLFYVAAAGKSFGRLNVLYQQTMSGAERIFELLDTKTDLTEDPNGVVLDHVEGKVEFEDVGFEYNPGKVVLRGVSFTIDPGEVVAIVGPSGAGKSTCADLILRFYDVTGGRIMVEGHDIRHIKTESLRKHIAMVPQETILFSGTIAENISYGRPGADMSEIINVATAANAHEFIQQMPNGYDTRLGEGGVGLSGGQRQRISIARALLKNPRILILDEATSSLDAASEGVVQEALDRLMRGRSTLVIAHRLSTVTGADRILVIDRGFVVESGSFDDLMAQGGLFAQLYKTQSRVEEVASS